MKVRDLSRINKIIEYIDNIEEDVQGMDVNDYSADRKTKFSTAHALGQIGELAKNLSDELRQEYSHIPWKDIMRFRDRVVHGYDKMSLFIIWDTISVHLPLLKEDLTKITIEITGENT
ncbi:MAG: DUF86 domain-containing protein [Oscillospiraceae bacterium]|nr:DUF86 domain-containing protein [Oscillospiraceae bacterium]